MGLGGGGGGRGKVLLCPRWVNTQQVAELYGVRMLVKDAVKRKLPESVILQDNLKATWAMANL